METLVLEQVIKVKLNKLCTMFGHQVWHMPWIEQVQQIEMPYSLYLKLREVLVIIHKNLTSADQVWKGFERNTENNSGMHFKMNPKKKEKPLLSTGMVNCFDLC